MRKLDRNAARAPSCLTSYKHGRDKWDAVTSEDKNEIWSSLRQMQGERCAYCENSIQTQTVPRTAHIEHFRQRAKYPQGTFEWENLFGSCNSESCCGKYKDKQTYQHHDIIKMDQEDPDEYLRFHPSGHVTPRRGLNAMQHKKSTETIRVFNLDNALQEIRRVHIYSHIQTAMDLAQLAEEMDIDEWLFLLESELEAVSELPFATAIRHVLDFSK